MRLTYVLAKNGTSTIFECIKNQSPKLISLEAVFAGKLVLKSLPRRQHTGFGCLLGSSSKETLERLNNQQKNTELKAPIHWLEICLSQPSFG